MNTSVSLLRFTDAPIFTIGWRVLWKIRSRYFFRRRRAYFMNEYNNNNKIRSAAAVEGVESVENTRINHICLYRQVLHMLKVNWNRWERFCTVFNIQPSSTSFNVNCWITCAWVAWQSACGSSHFPLRFNALSTRYQPDIPSKQPRMFHPRLFSGMDCYR